MVLAVIVMRFCLRHPHQRGLNIANLAVLPNPFAFR